MKNLNKYYKIIEWADKINTKAKGWIVIDKLINNIAGGGIFMHTKANLKEVKDLACTMTMKNSLQNPIHGGAKAGICYDPYDKDAVNVLKRFLKDNIDLIKTHWCTASDFNTNNDVIQKYLQELGIGSGFFSLGNVISKINNYPENQAFSLIENIKKKVTPFFPLDVCATGYGVSQSINLLKDTKKLPRVIIQGFGVVGTSLAYFLHKDNIAKVIGIIELDCFIYSTTFLPICTIIENTINNINIGNQSRLYQFTKNFSGNHNFKVKYRNEENDIDFLDHCLAEVKADVFSPCALRYQITDKILNTLIEKTFAENKTSYIICGANNAFKNKNIINKCYNNKITTIPEWVSNSGNATLFVESLKKCDFSQWESRALEKIKNKIEIFLLEAKTMCSNKISLHDACYLLANQNIRKYE